MQSFFFSTGFSDIIYPMSQKTTIARSALHISLATFLSRILGFVRDMVIAGYFGATGLSDTFFVAFRIPNLLRELFAEGSMSSAFIPVLTEKMTKEGKDEADRLTHIVFTFILFGVGSVTILGILFAPYIVRLIAPGFNDPSKVGQTALLTRIMFPFLLFVSLAAFAMGALNVKRSFFIPALSSAWFNVTIILTIVALSGLFADPILAVAIGVTFGGMMQFLTQVPSLARSGYTFRINPAFRDEGFRKMGRLILPSIVGLAVAQINIFVSTVLASYLEEGSITYLYYSMRLIQFPVGIFGVAMGMAVLPSLSEHAARNDREALKEDFSSSIRFLFFITLPAMVGLIALRTPIINLLFQRGEFDYTATQGTAFALTFYAIGIWSMVGVRVVVAAFYSLQDTRTPVKVAVTAMLTNILLSLILMGPLRHGGLALANSLASWLNFTLLFLLLRKRLGGIEAARIKRSFLKAIAAAVIMGIAGYLVSTTGDWTGSGEILRRVFILSASITVSVLLYFLLAWILRSEELDMLRRLIQRKDR